MKSITVGQLRQNPTEALAAVEAGETYEITRHRTVIARITPPTAPSVPVMPRVNRGGSSLSGRPPFRSAAETERALASMEEWR